MPYISPAARKALDAKVQELADAVTFEYLGDPGVINYVITTMINRIIAKRWTGFGYGVIAQMMGVLDTIKMEFYRKVAEPYEDRKAAENGEIPWPE